MRRYAARSAVFFKNETSAATANAKGSLPLENELCRCYFEDRTTGPLSQSGDDISTLGKCLQKMLVLDPRNGPQTDVLLRDLWFTRSALKDV